LSVFSKKNQSGHRKNLGPKTSDLGQIQFHCGTSPCEGLSWQCWQHVGNMLGTYQKVAKFGLTCVSVPIQKSTMTQEFCIRNHQQIVDTVVRTDTVIRTYCSTYVPQGAVAIQQFPQNSATIILDRATFLITIEPVCVVVIAIWAALLLCITNNELGSYVMRYYF
jgi:hypothetical protein